MSKVDELVINYAIYEDAVEYLGTTEVTLPDLEYMTEELSGRHCGKYRRNHYRSLKCNVNNFQFPNCHSSSSQADGTTGTQN